MADNGTLTVYQRIADPLAAVNQFGTDIAKSGLFGCQNIEQGRVFAWECLVRGQPALSLAEDYHVIDNKLSMKADAMLARFEERGGKCKLKSRTPDLVSVELTKSNGEIHNFSLSWEEAQQEPFVYSGKEKENAALLAAGKKPAAIKTKYSTPRSRMQMLWARLVSDAIRATDPGVIRGKYTPEEIGDFRDDDGPGSNGHAVPASSSVVDQAEAAAKQTAIDVPFETKPAEQHAEQPAAESTTPPVDNSGPSTTMVRQSIAEMFALLEMTADQQEAALKKRGCQSLRHLTQAQAIELLDKLKAKHKEKCNAKLPPVEPGNEPVYSSSGQCTAEQEQRIKTALAEWAQIDRDTYTAEMTAFKQKLVASGRQKILDLSANDAARLYDCVQTRKLASFLQRSLEDWKPKTEAAATSA